jgi:aerobic carbon-monoxide dehydrogenase large subunit
MQNQTQTRREDHRLLTGSGLFAADGLTPETLFAGFLRADIASGRVTRLDVPRVCGDVLAVFTAADPAADNVASIPHEVLPRDDGATPVVCPLPLLCDDHVRHIGEPLAMIVARSRAAVADAMDGIEVDIDDAPAVTGIAFLRRLGDAGAVTAALADAHHQITAQIDVPRATAASLEPRGGIAIARPDGGLNYSVSTQSPFAIRAQLCTLFGWKPEMVHVTAPDVGGSFGLKGFMTREDALLCWAARRLGASIAWLPSRSEAMLSDSQGRGVTGHISLGFDADMRITALDADLHVDAGAYPTRRAVGLIGNSGGLTGMYDIPVVSAQITGHLSARAPLAPFRGNGRPEASFAIERALDQAARQIGCDPVDLRRRNLIPTADMPTTTAFGMQFDCGDFPQVMATAESFRTGSEGRRAATQAQGLLFGTGLANCVESAGGPIRGPKIDHARLTIGPGDAVTLAPGVMSVGQGHETGLTTMLAGALQIDPGRVTYINGDTAALVHGRGSGGSSGLTVAGSAVRVALDRALAEGRAAAARHLGCAQDDLSFRDGAFYRDGTNEAATLSDLAQRHPNGRWVIDGDFTPPAATFPNGTHYCEVSVDPATGQVRITRYGAVEDIGRVLNPVLVDGQLHGGIAQGLSQGLGEQMIHDDTGQILSGSFMDYRMLRADDVPFMHTATVEVPTTRNPLGVKGVGEAGTVGATAALALALGDALARAGVADFQPPASPHRVWQALHDAGHPAAC